MSAGGVRVPGNSAGLGGQSGRDPLSACEGLLGGDKVPPGGGSPSIL